MGRNFLRHRSVFCKVIFVTPLILFGKISVENTVRFKFRLDFISKIWNEHMIFFHSGIVIIDVGRHAVFHLEEIVSITIHIHLRRRRQSH